MIKKLMKWWCKHFGHDMYVMTPYSTWGELVYCPKGGFNCPRCGEWLDYKR